MPIPGLVEVVMASPFLMAPPAVVTLAKTVPVVVIGYLLPLVF